MLTAEELEEKKKHEAELMWQKLLAYYMMETYVTKAQAQAEAEMRNAYLVTSRYIEKHGLLNRLFEKKGNGPSPAELLAEIGRYEPPDSPLGELYIVMQNEPHSEEKLSRALERVIVEEPPRMLVAAEEERDRHVEWQRANAEALQAPNGPELVDEAHVRYQEQLAKKMAFLRAVMSPELYKELERGLEIGEYQIDYERAVEQEKQEKQKKEPEQKTDYQSYIQQKRVEPEEKAGKLVNAGDVYSAAAYMLAAYEQKDEKEFDPEKADARAMELSGTRAFKTYMKGHPGNLLAAARGTAVKETSEGVTALDADLSRRDKILTDARDNLKKMASGKTPCFRQMLNALDRFVNEDTEPTREQKSDLLHALGTYLTTDCSPKSREYNKECFTQAMCSVKALLPDKDFDKVIEQVNVGREPKVKSADFEVVKPVKGQAQAEPTQELVRKSVPH